MSDLQADSYSGGAVNGQVCTSCELVDGVAYVENGVLPEIGVGNAVLIDGVSFLVAGVVIDDRTALTLTEA